ncbi:segregation/condensation protein A [Bacillus sp. FJAT-45350]|uniref:segregation/condensation protein A n=1 Tax=Bacillus sp. FJAT-45350 TaxID=2011014 RepID=UPI000BB6A624|nr:segregation/condensation protein A [Bacillus sp. FJAT-45350]
MINPYNVKLDAFEGPLDLLLHLINQAKVDIYDIPVARITDQYMHYIHTMQELQLDVASEYLVMAATLIQIKSSMLLPKQQEELLDDYSFDEEEEDPRQELMNRLIEYRKYKEAAKELKEKEQERSLVHMKAPSDLEPYLSEKETNEVSISGVSLYDMVNAYQKMLKRKILNKPLERTIKSQEYSIEERMGEIMEDLRAKPGKQSFSFLFQSRERSHVVVTFLALLELMKTNAIRCEQEGNFSDIMISSYEEGKVH